jgi:hypothetical protein
VDAERDSGADVPHHVLHIFRDDDARPKVIGTYNANIGWVGQSGSLVLTWEVVDELIDSGKTSVELKWRSKRHQVSLLDLRPKQSPLRRSEVQSDVRSTRRGF